MVVRLDWLVYCQGQ